MLAEGLACGALPGPLCVGGLVLAHALDCRGAEAVGYPFQCLHVRIAEELQHAGIANKRLPALPVECAG